MTCGVYQIINKNNGHCYIGSSMYIEERFKAHRGQLRRGTHHAPKLQAAWKRDGADAFLFLIIEEGAPDSLNDIEQRWMDMTRSYGYGYNGRPTADKHGLLPEITKQRMREGSKRAGLDPELRRLRSERAKQQHAEGRLGRHLWSAEAEATQTSKIVQARIRRRANTLA